MPAEANKKDEADNKKPDETTEVETPEANELGIVPTPRAPALPMPRFGLAEESRNVWRVTVPAETLPEQILDEAFWANVSRLLQPGDEIQVLPDDYSWRCDLHVAAVGNNWAQVVKWKFRDLAPASEHAPVPSRYKTQFAGAHHKWRVLRDGSPLKDGFASEKLARQWAANHEAAVNR